MGLKEIRKNNDDQFIKDIRSVAEFGVIARQSGLYFKILKHDVLTNAEQTKINYYISSDIYVSKRDVMIIY